MAQPNFFLLSLIFSLVFSADMAVSAPSYTSFISDSCKATIYPTDCVQSLSPYSGTIKNSPRIMAQTALTVAQTQAQSGKSLVVKLFKVKETKANEHKALDDCLDQMSSSVDLLSQSVKELQLIGKNDSKSISWRISNVQTWVSTALTSQTTCLDAFEDLNGKIKDEISSSVTKTEKVTSNALALVNKFSRENTI